MNYLKTKNDSRSEKYQYRFTDYYNYMYFATVKNMYLFAYLYF